jgi:DNA-binding beta-propeller fold protein YncE
MGDENSVSEQAPKQDDYYEETIVEYVDNGGRRRILIVILILLVLLLSAVGYFVVRLARPAGSPTSSELPKGVTWVRSFYSFGPGVDQALVSPTATDIGSDGTIWTIASKRYIVGFSPSGQVRRVIAPQLGPGEGQVTSLEGVAVGDDGSVYVTDFGNNRIDVFSAAGAFVRSWAVQLPQVIDVKGNRVAVAASNGIGLFDTSGKLIAKWGSRGTGNDQVDLPHGILIGQDNNVYVADTHNRRVTAFSANGRILWRIADPNKTGANLASTDASVPVVNGVKQSLFLPTGLAQDSAGHLLLTDTFSFEVAVMDPKAKGRIIARYGEEGQRDGQFAYPTGVSYDRDRDWIAVADTSNNRVQIIRIPGTGGSAVRRGLKSITDTPIWLCSIPLFLLLLAVFLWRRGRRTEDETTESAQE